MQASATAGLALRPRAARCFDEVHDVAAFDLVLVMDHFDHTEVGARIFPALYSNSLTAMLIPARCGLRPTRRRQGPPRLTCRGCKR